MRLHGSALTAAILCASAFLPLAGCNTPTDVFRSAAEESAAKRNRTIRDDSVNTEAAEANIVRKAPTVSRKGTNIRAVVNGDAITSYDIQRRAAFLKLRRVGGDRSQKALDELVEEKIKLQEAKRRNTVASDAQVSESYANFAKSNGMSTGQLTNVLGQAGVGADHFREFIRGQISWQRTVGSKFRAEAQSKSAQAVMSEIRQSGGNKPQTTEYQLEQMIFVVPTAKRKAMLSQRRKEASALRQLVSGCNNLKQLAATQRDVTARKLQRTLEPQLPPEWVEEVKATPEGAPTNIQNTDMGVEFLVVCSRRTVSDDNAARVLDQARRFEAFNEQGSQIADGYLAELKAKSQIIYR